MILYGMTCFRIFALISDSASRKEIARRAQAHSEEWKKKMEVAHDDLTNHKEDQKAITTGRQERWKLTYKRFLRETLERLKMISKVTKGITTRILWWKVL